jgi:hypothetical protein
MQERGPSYIVLVDLFGADKHVGAGVATELEGPLAVFLKQTAETHPVRSSDTLKTNCA